MQCGTGTGTGLSGEKRYRNGGPQGDGKNTFPAGPGGPGTDGDQQSSHRRRRADPCRSLREGIVDHALFFIAPKIMGGGESREAIGDLGIHRMKDVVRLDAVHTERIGEDVLIEGDVLPSALLQPSVPVDRGTQKSEWV
jgi:hypothetical protein